MILNPHPASSNTSLPWLKSIRAGNAKRRKNMMAIGQVRTESEELCKWIGRSLWDVTIATIATATPDQRSSSTGVGSWRRKSFTIKLTTVIKCEHPCASHKNMSTIRPSKFVKREVEFGNDKRMDFGGQGRYDWLFFLCNLCMSSAGWKVRLVIMHCSWTQTYKFNCDSTVIQRLPSHLTPAGRVNRASSHQSSAPLRLPFADRHFSIQPRSSVLMLLPFPLKANMIAGRSQSGTATLGLWRMSVATGWLVNPELKAVMPYVSPKR